MLVCMKTQHLGVSCGKYGTWLHLLCCIFHTHLQQCFNYIKYHFDTSDQRKPHSYIYYI